MKTRTTLPLLVFLCLILTELSYGKSGGEEFAGIHCPEDKFVDCDDELWDLSIYGNAEYVDYTGSHDAGKPTVKYYLNSCGQGHIKRTWKVKIYGQWHSCSQYIYVAGSDAKVHINWPEDIELEGCNPNTHPNKIQNGKPTWNTSDCSMLASSHRDTYFNFGSSSCNKIIREWTVMDWCTYDAYRNPYKGIYKHSQTIKIVNDEIPEVDCPQDVTVSSYNCVSAFVDIPQIAVDESTCGGEYTVKNDSPFAQSSGKNISGEYPLGTTQVTYSITYGCGHRINCKVNVTVTNDKAPTPICRGDLTVALMGMDTDGDHRNDVGMVEVWAKDLDKGSEGACGSEELFFSFSENINDSVRIFTCDDVGKNDVAMYVTDKLGNQDFCTVKVSIQNNAANIINCSPDQESAGEETETTETNQDGHTTIAVDSSLFIAGSIHDQFGEAVDGMEIEISNPAGKIEITASVDTIIEIKIDSTWTNSNWDYQLVVDTIPVPSYDTTYTDEYQMVVSDETGNYIIQNYFEKNKNYMVTGYEGSEDFRLPEVLDLRILYDHVTGRTPFNKHFQYLAADLNTDGKIDFTDVNELINAIIDGKVDYSSGITFRVIKNDSELPLDQSILKKEDMSYYMVENIESSFDEADFMVIYLGKFLPESYEVNRNNIQTRSNNLFSLRGLASEAELKVALDKYFGYTEEMVKEVSLYPNPVRDNLTIELMIDDAQMATIQFMDMNGKTVLSLNSFLEKGLNKINVPLVNVPDGMYISSISTGSNSINKRVIIDR